jgi:16S rRNA (guanine966-N2)-methyltransferase
MRIVGGTHRSRPFHIPAHLGIRPTTDFAKEALFNILHNRIDFEGMNVLDLFGGSGSISYEFSSRGCATITTIEKNIKCCELIKKNIKNLKLENIRIIKSDVFTFLKSCSATFDIIFADPPFRLENIARIPAIVFEKNLLKENGMLIVEHPLEVDFRELPFEKETREYGTVNFSIFNRQQTV